MGLFNKEIQVNEKRKNNKTNTIKIKSLSGYDAIIKKINENDTMTVKYPMANEQTKTKVSIGL